MTFATILIPFLTGLTTGGLSCFAVQGGLLTSSIASSNERKQPGNQPNKQRLLQPILLFLTSKLVVHAILGFLLGLVGSVLTPSPVMRGLLQLAVGIFMVGNALRMLDVHPFFRVFSFEPPQSITRMIRKKAKKGSKDNSTPLFLGALTVLIPCGVTQVMMAAAISAGSPWTGMAILTAFILGASPTFFGVTYLAARISAMFEKSFTRVLAVMILLLGIYSVDTGLNLAGSPYSLTRAVTSLTAPAPEPATSLPQPLVDGLAAPNPGVVNAGSQSGELVITVHNNGYSPAVMVAPAGKPLTLKLVTNGVYSCSRAFVIPSLNYQKLLQANGEVSLQLPAQPAGSVLRYMCSMGMYNGEIRFE